MKLRNSDAIFARLAFAKKSIKVYVELQAPKKINVN